MADYDEDDDLFQDLYGDDSSSVAKPAKTELDIPQKGPDGQAAPLLNDIEHGAPQSNAAGAAVLEPSTNGAITSQTERLSNSAAADSGLAKKTPHESAPPAFSAFGTTTAGMGFASAPAASSELAGQKTDTQILSAEEVPEESARDHGPDVKQDGKMFIGGLNWETTDESLRNYFSQFGEVADCSVMRDSTTGRSRGFGFLTFKNPRVVNSVVVKEHFLDGKIIDPKRAIPRDEQEKTAKIFVGGIAQDVTEEEFRDYFTQFGRVLDATLMMDKESGRPRGFGFITFAEDSSVDNAMAQPYLALKDKTVEVKRAQPKGREREERPRSFNQGYGGASGGTYSGAGGPATMGMMNPMMAGPQAMYGGMSPAMMAQYYAQMQKYMAMWQQSMGRGMAMPNMMAGGAGGFGMNPQQMQQMQQFQQMQMMAQAGSGMGNSGNRSNEDDGGGQDDYNSDTPAGLAGYGSPPSGPRASSAGPPPNAPLGPARGGRGGGGRGARGGFGQRGNARFNPYGR